jgi:hypothetical protein
MAEPYCSTIRRPAAGTFISLRSSESDRCTCGHAAQTRTGRMGCRRSACVLTDPNFDVQGGEYGRLSTTSSIDHRSRESIVLRSAVARLALKTHSLDGRTQQSNFRLMVTRTF